MITALTSQKRNLDRINVFIDGEFAFGLSSEAAAGLRVGQVLTSSEISSLKNQDEGKKAKMLAVRLIT